MGLLIDNTFFKNDLQIPGAVVQPTIIGSSTTTAVQQLEDCITYVESEILTEALGLSMYQSLKSSLPITDASEDKWKNLVKGTTYGGKIFEGIGTAKSLLAYAVYYTYLDQNSSFWTTHGIEKPQSENSATVTPVYKLATAHQKFIKKYQGDQCPEPYRAKIGGVRFIDYYGEHSDVNVSLFKFLVDNKADYDWEQINFKFYKSINTFGL